MENKKYYYKHKTAKAKFELLHPINNPDFIEITKEEWESIKFKRTVPTPEQAAESLRKLKIRTYKTELAKTDYVVIKIAESDDPDEIAALREEYATVIAHRKELRAQINELEGELE